MKDINQIFTDWYTDIYDDMENCSGDIELFLELIGGKPANILEIGCGNGRILIPLAEAGHNILGFDLAENMLNSIRKKCTLPNLRYQYIDAISDDWGMEYDIVIMGGNLLHNVEGDISYKDIQALFIRKASLALNNGGHLLIDFELFAYPELVFIADDGRLIYEGIDSTGVVGKFYVFCDSYDATTHYAAGRRRFEFTMPDGQVEYINQTWSKHILTLEQVYSWLNSSGIEVELLYGDYNKNPISDNTNRAIIWAVKK
ncbi:MAG TPA: class I SAM-dependent methyltransferase [Mobilitalea sp.]|nr:class I SAM-dependent methyltransferase [Mobilitalea sp.]